jgi:hypothetical protein
VNSLSLAASKSALALKYASSIPGFASLAPASFSVNFLSSSASASSATDLISSISLMSLLTS